MDIALECTDLRKTFRNKNEIGPVTFEVNRGEVFGLLGPDGAGKTTTMRMLCGVLESSGGKATVLGVDVIADPDGIKERIGYMSQRFSLYGDLTVSENIEFFADIFQVPLADRPKRTEQLLAASRLTPFKDRLAANLSGGMKQKLALVCTLIHTPQLLVLDEPTTGVDPVSRRDFWQILYSLVKEGITLVVSTPYMDEAERCNRVALMNRGKILLCDTPQGVRKRMTGVVIELLTSNSWEARTRLVLEPWVDSVEVYGNRLHVVVKQNTVTTKIAERVESTLTADKFDVESCREIPAGLEDVFVTLMQKDDNERDHSN